MESLGKKCAAEMLGTFWLVMGGCGSAVLAANFGGDGNPLGLGLLGVSLAFGIAVATAAFAFGPISGGHFNPAVSLGLWIGGRFRGSHLPAYVVSQVVGGLLAGALLWTIINGTPDFLPPSGAGAFATNGYDGYSPGSYGLPVALLVEVVMTAVFLYVIMAVTRPAAAPGWAPFAIGAALALIHMISIPVTNTSVNPARSTAVAAFVRDSAGSMPMQQLWLFWLAPCVGAVIGSLIYRGLNREARERA
ncbi:MAG TPA: aquaporin Z [Stenotrophomonas sp.]|jgi:aquaporin Z